MRLLSRVTAPLSAIARPFRIDDPVVTVMEALAMMVPWNAVFVPRVAELPTCQKTLPADAPLISVTLELLAVVSVLPIWKMKRALELPWPSRTSAVFSCAEDEKQYTPGVRVLFKSGATVLQGRPTRSL